MGLTADEKKGVGRLNAGDHAGSKTAASIRHWFGFLIRTRQRVEVEEIQKKKANKVNRLKMYMGFCPKEQVSGKGYGSVCVKLAPCFC